MKLDRTYLCILQWCMHGREGEELGGLTKQKLPTYTEHLDSSMEQDTHKGLWRNQLLGGAWFHIPLFASARIHSVPMLCLGIVYDTNLKLRHLPSFSGLLT